MEFGLKKDSENFRVMKARIIELSFQALTPKHEHRHFAQDKLVAICETAELIGWDKVSEMAALFIEAADFQNSKLRRK